MTSVTNVEETALYLPLEFVTESVGFTFDVGEILKTFKAIFYSSQNLVKLHCIELACILVQLGILMQRQ